MPVTLGCPSCGKRFRARDESVGKRVKCPFCQAAVPVPSPEEAHNASAPTDVVEGPPLSALSDMDPQQPGAGVPPELHAPGSRSSPVPVSSPAAWGASGSHHGDSTEAEQPPPIPRPAGPRPPARPMRQSTLPDRNKLGAPAKPAQTPEQHLAGAWAKVSSGLFWVLFGLFFIALMSFVPFGKLVYERSVGPLPEGEGWVKIEGYVNTPGPDAIVLNKSEEIDLLAYGAPILLAALTITLGRITAGAAPRNSGAKGLFVFSGMFTLLAATGLLSYTVSQKLNFGEVKGYSEIAMYVCGVLAEFWFLLALAASGATLKRPKAVRSVGLYAMVLGLAYVVVTIGWNLYANKFGPELFNRPRVLDKTSDWMFYETGAKMLGCLLLIGVYWQAVAGVKRAAREFVRDLRDSGAA